MHEYIKKLSYSLCLIGQATTNPKFKDGISQLEMSLISMASVFLVVRTERIETHEFYRLRRTLVQIIDLFDLAKVANTVTVVNSGIIIAAALRLIEEIDMTLHRNGSFSLPRNALSIMSDKLLRDRARDEEQNKFLTNKFQNNENEYFNHTKISEPSFSEIVDTPAPSSESIDVRNTETEIPKFDWGNEQPKPKSPLVYTFFGSEDKIIEDRKVKLLEVLKIGGGVSIGDIGKNFPGLNTKTLQRDLIELMREKKVVMLGKKRWAKYYLK